MNTPGTVERPLCVAVIGSGAPDQKINAVTAVYERVAFDPRVRFFGNVTLGRGLSVEELRARYDQIVYAVGCESDRPIAFLANGRILRDHRPGRLVGDRTVSFVGFKTGASPFAIATALFTSGAYC